MEEAPWDLEWEKVQVRSGLAEEEGRFHTVRTFLEFVRTTFGGLGGLRVLELGCGLGRISLLMAQEGAQVTLVDESALALRKARQLFALYGFEPATLQLDLLTGDAAHLPDHQDVVLSWGLMEHFRGEETYRVARLHVGQAIPGGVVGISVPNALSPVYILWRSIIEATGRWTFGEEFPYTAAKLRALAAVVGLEQGKILFAPLLEGLDRFFVARGGPPRLPVLPLGPLDRLGYQIALIGTRPGPR